MRKATCTVYILSRLPHAFAALGCTVGHYLRSLFRKYFCKGYVIIRIPNHPSEDIAHYNTPGYTVQSLKTKLHQPLAAYNMLSISTNGCKENCAHYSSCINYPVMLA